MPDNQSVLIVVEVKGGTPAPAAAELFTAAKAITADESIFALVVGTGAREAAVAVGRLGAVKVFAAEVGQVSSDAVALTVMPLAANLNPKIILLAETDLGRDLAPMLAARLSTAAVTDVIAIRTEGGSRIFTRPVYGGNALADFTIDTEPQVVSIRPKTFAPAPANDKHTVEILELPAAEPLTGVQILERVAVKETGPKIEEAKIVVGGGRGLGGPEGFAQLQELAGLLDGVVGASRPPCDQGWWPESGQIGVTGKIIAPDLYIAVGISGSSQHLSGVSGAKTLVAINKDAEANIFKAAAYGVTGDWKKVVPALVAKVKELTGR
ncbi:electron transfer flavoprotein subunit alpha/FixB family protein [Dehalogenimonas alkenigignens]|uniref:Electron transfer flavoprotein alpha subunit apoprotein n=1 Tax=Dehalogenimonas alkenigignens TaxID=1217799 RepID=A0A0W0GJU4_9CHLR|nr:electron transfer flavoprotein subunit alpha/FixB family protein [Dehalogenimonas alkenigignens]KTB48843.1 electron transfer flavoprotein alpha subunit apoprotein [Dehalogenimonas alkenigignens]PVV84750.1 electron transfer flavoprotein subunit alpha/FixB family protein [Dehalogenimonas alkenigignens]